MTSKILYIGNNFAKHSRYKTTMESLSALLEKEQFVVIKHSDKKNKFLRLFNMCFSVFTNRKKVSFVLIDTYSTTNFYFAFCTSQLARLFHLKYIPILHGGNLPYRLDNSKKLAKLIFKNAHKNVAPSKYLKNEFEKRNYQVEFIPNILEIEKYTYKMRTQIKPKILWVRAFRKLYNPTMAIEVLRLVKKQYPQAKLCMVGPEKDESFKTTKNLVARYKLEDSVMFTGILSQKKWHKKAADFDVFINTTNIDNTPVSVMEAMALGLFIVSTNVGGMPFLIENGKDGILVDKENPQQMAAAIIKIIEENNQKLAVNARIKAESFDWDVVREKWLKILE